MESIPLRSKLFDRILDRPAQRAELPESPTSYDHRKSGYRAPGGGTVIYPRPLTRKAM